MFNRFYNSLKRKSQKIESIQTIQEFHSIGIKSPKINLGQIQSCNNNLKDQLESLSEVEFQVFSQFGDDGIIQWLINKLKVPHKTFIEFGVENYQEANTRFLLVNNYWAGLIIDGNPSNIKSIRSEILHNFYDLQAECSFITKENINSIISTAKFHDDVGILSIDVDGNDYWIWKEINKINPIIVISEYNSLFGFDHPYTIEYNEDFVRGTSYPFNFYGSSLLSLHDLASEKGYGFIGCNSAGNNAYFIRRDYMQTCGIKEQSIKQAYNFSSFSEVWDEKGIPLRGMEKVKSLAGLPVYNTRINKVETFDPQPITASLINAGKSTRS